MNKNRRTDREIKRQRDKDWHEDKQRAGEGGGPE